MLMLSSGKVRTLVMRGAVTGRRAAAERLGLVSDEALPLLQRVGALLSLLLHALALLHLAAPREPAIPSAPR